jgi:RNA recognition motif-containing protein
VKQHLYVGNLPKSYTEDQLRDLFAADGREVETVTIRMRAKTGKSRGFGFIKMGSEDHAIAAVGALNETDLEGRTIKVREAFRDTRDRIVTIEYEDRGPMRGGRR